MKRLSKIFAALALLLAATACSNNEPQAPATDEQGRYCSVMTLDGGIVDYDASRATTTEWHDGDSLIIRFKHGYDYIEAIATYRSASLNWLIVSSDVPSSDYSSTCDVVYISNAERHERLSITLNKDSRPYYASEATYNYTGGRFHIVATLKPRLGRIRFTGEPGTRVGIKGFNYLTGFDVNSHSFSEQEYVDIITIGSDGYSPYCYGYYPNGIEERIWISHPDGPRFWKRMRTGSMQPGSSGSITIPTAAENFGWEAVISSTPLEFEVGGVKFKMIPVEGGNFIMGATKEQLIYADGYEKPAHQVMLSDFYISETEVTQALWSAISGSLEQWTETMGVGDNFPVYCTDGETCENFIRKLNIVTGENFRLPTEAEWEYAARGGQKSKGFIYSGSDNLDEVAWYSANSGNLYHEVAKKLPNELGIYDMSGNVQEWCKDAYYAYDYPQTDPCYIYVKPGIIRGGHRTDEAVYCRVSYRESYDSWSTEYTDLGLRLVLPIKKLAAE